MAIPRGEHRRTFIDNIIRDVLVTIVGEYPTYPWCSLIRIMHSFASKTTCINNLCGKIPIKCTDSDEESEGISTEKKFRTHEVSKTRLRGLTNASAGSGETHLY